MGKLVPKSPMPWNSFKRMTDNDIKAVYNFLQTQKPVKTKAK
jgi:mono/diheme cytochrome c family protein